MKHHHDATIEGGTCPECGYEMNYYDLMAYAVEHDIHSAERAREILNTAPRIIGTVRMQVECPECNTPLEIQGTWLCVWHLIEPRLLSDPPGTEIPIG
jgi:hypothetical protein